MAGCGGDHPADPGCGGVGRVVGAGRGAPGDAGQPGGGPARLQQEAGGGGVRGRVPAPRRHILPHQAGGGGQETECCVQGISYFYSSYCTPCESSVCLFLALPEDEVAF